jgi:hypothetical protein
MAQISREARESMRDELRPSGAARREQDPFSRFDCYTTNRERLLEPTNRHESYFAISILRRPIAQYDIDASALDDVSVVIRWNVWRAEHNPARNAV